MKVPIELRPSYDKVLHGMRLNLEDGLLLFSTPHIDIVQNMANIARQRKASDFVSYSVNLYVHPTNLCAFSCPICSFSSKPGSKNAWLLSPQEIENQVQEAIPLGIDEVHIVGGLWPTCSLDYYEEVVQRIRSIAPHVFIKALTAVECHYLSTLHSIGIDDVLLCLKHAGVNSLTGGGAEILNDDIRKKITPQKISSQEYLDIHERAHTLGLRSNITMLFGHIEEPLHIIQHCIKIRELQDRTGGFQAFVPLKYHRENNAFGTSKTLLKPKEITRIYALSRLMLDSIRDIKVLWNYVGVDEASSLLSWGCNDISSTAFGEKVVSMAGGVRFTMTEEAIKTLILKAGKIPQKAHENHDIKRVL